MGWKDRACRVKAKAKKMQGEAKENVPALTKKVVKKLSTKQLERIQDLVTDELILRRDIGRR